MKKSNYIAIFALAMAALSLFVLVNQLLDGNSTVYFSPAIFVVFIIIYQQQHYGLARQVMRIQKQRKGVNTMSETLKQFIGKECKITIALSGGTLKGTVLAVEGNWLTLQTKDNVNTVNADFVLRITEAKK